MTQKTKGLILLLVALLLCSLTVSAQTALNLVGQWRGEEEPDRQTEFYLAKDGFYYGKVINNPSRNSKNRTLIFKKVKFDEATGTYQGLMSPPDGKIEVNATIRLLTHDKLQVVGKKLFITKTFHFVRIR